MKSLAAKLVDELWNDLPTFADGGKQPTYREAVALVVRAQKEAFEQCAKLAESAEVWLSGECIDWKHQGAASARVQIAAIIRKAAT